LGNHGVPVAGALITPRLFSSLTTKCTACGGKVMERYESVTCTFSPAPFEVNRCNWHCGDKNAVHIDES
jgi:hypothetical protein